MKVKEQINSGDLVVPGDVLGVIEEFIADSGTYEEGGLILASIIGNVNVNTKTKRISVIAKNNKPITPVKGAIVYGKVSDAKKQLVDLTIGKIDSTELHTPVTGTLHISCVSESYTENMTDAYRIGDIVKAHVVDDKRQPCYISTVGHQFGCILARCTRCGAYLQRKGRSTLKCMDCENVERRKISEDYLSI
ncbi:exosome complex RNA-binding protein Csl4 [Candidatus Borrarchaeum sp.]|uniref:exosome complex RNA-binding protein Csl4 n=1 Tax=Candidatus Borrarchaeum sp. TaxID=2846742 RepID=UPI00257F2B6E|nr:exosome complex RNA-binding protein Csl4 [Candidatus Borrarchaeum sp.]